MSWLVYELHASYPIETVTRYYVARKLLLGTKRCFCKELKGMYYLIKRIALQQIPAKFQI